ncbi:MAG: SIS domain-containing protein [Candidatus Aenigmatarchaeota archaeon]
MFLVEEVAENFGAHFREALERYRGLERLNGRTLMVGMGGSGVPAAFAAENSKDVIVHKGYFRDLTHSIGSFNNVVLSSYSGGTEEVLSFAERLDRFTAVTCGGKLGEMARAKSNPVIALPENFQPRAAVPYPIAAFSYLLGFDAALAGHAAAAEKARVDRISDELLEFLAGRKAVAVCGVPGLASAAYYLKAGLNENSKLPAFYAELPEDNHCGLEALSPDVPYMIFGEPANERIRKRAEFMCGVGPHVLWIKNNNPVELLWIAMKVSVLLAKKRGVSPDELNRVPGLKKFLA